MTRRPCLDCRIIFEGSGSRCPRCQREWDQRRNQARPQYQGDYPRQAAIVRANATRCWICGNGAIAGDPWTADHVSETELREAHRSCNSGRGRNNPIFHN